MRAPTWIALAPLAASAAAFASPPRTVDISVTFKRTVAVSTTDVFTSGACKELTKEATSFTELVSFGSTAYPLDDDTNEITVESNGSTPPASFKPMTGTGTYDYTASHHKQGCNSSEDIDGSARATVDASGITFGLRYARDRASGDLSLGATFGAPAGKGKIKSFTAPGPAMELDAAPLVQAQSQAMAASLGPVSLRTAAMWASMGPAAAQLKKAFEVSAQSANMTVSVVGSGFQVQYHDAHEIPADKLNPPSSGHKLTGSYKVTTDVSVSIGGPPNKYEAILEPVGSVQGAQIADYKHFIPIGDKPGDADGKNDSVAFRVYVIKKDKPSEKVNIPFEVKYALESSKEPGSSINDPLHGKDDNDLEWHPIVAHMSGLQKQTDTTLQSTPDQGGQLMAIVRSRDFGAYGKLRAHVHLKTGEELDAHLAGKTTIEVAIPYDETGNHIADEWENKQKLRSNAATADDEHADGNDHDGDGLTLYEEYRGVRCNGKHVRLDPSKKDLFLVSLSSRSLDAGAAMFETATGKTVAVHVCKSGEVDPSTKVVNPNTSFGKGGVQHAVLVKEQAIPGADVVAYTQPEAVTSDGSIAGRRAARDNTAASPGHVVELDIDPSKAATTANFAYALAHETGHTVGIHHHGDSEPDQASIYKAWVAAGTAFLVDPSGKRIDWPKEAGTEVAQKSSQASGNVGCIMAYNNDFDLSLVGVVKDDPALVTALKSEGKDSPLTLDRPLIAYAKLPRRDGTTLCHQPDGTDINAKDRKPFSVYGQPAPGRGNCFSQMLIKDW